MWSLFSFYLLPTKVLSGGLGGHKSNAECQKIIWRRALFAFCISAPSVGGMCSIATPSVIIAWRASLNWTWGEFFLYMSQRKRWRYLKSLAAMVLFTPLEPNWANIGVTFGITFHRRRRSCTSGSWTTLVVVYWASVDVSRCFSR